MFDRKNVQDLYRLSPLQQGMLFHYLNDPRSTAYFEQTSFQLTGKVDQHLLEESFQHLVNQYEMLRTVFLYEHVTKPMQVVLKERKVRLYFQDLSWLGQEEQQQYIEKFLTEQREKGFDLSKDQLFQLALFQYSHDRFELIIQFHHILMDGWCLGILLNDLLENYERKKEGLPFLQKHVPRYSQYIRWLAEQDEEKGQRFWQQYLDGFEQTITIPEEKSIDQPYQLGVKKYVCSKAMTEQLNQYARKLQVTLNSVVQVLWALLLQKYNLTDDVLYGMVVSGRPPTISGVEKMVGLFINTVPCRVQSQGDESIQQLIQRIQQELLETEPYHHLSLADLLPNQEMIRHLIAFENYPFDESMLSRELGFQITDVHGFEQTHYDFNLVVAAGEQLAFTFRYNRSVYSTSTVDRIWNHLQFIMEQLINQQDMKVKDLSLVTPEEIHQLESWNQTESDFPAHQTIHELFALQVNKRPRHIAVIDGNKEITYAQLNQRANRLAYLLQKQGVKGETIVGVLARPSIDWVVGILAILKAGGAYLPIDPAYPADRIAYMLKDSSARLLLCQEGFGPPKQYDGKHLIIDEEGVEKELTDINGDAKNLAYVIYTSGSTGLPKGVMVEHRSLINLAYWHQQQYQLTEQDCCSKYAGLGFDASAWELFPTLLSGASLIIVPDELRHDPMALSQFFEQHGVTISFLPTQMAEQFMQVGNQSLRFLLTGGEELQQVSKTSYTLVNHYGPTENTVVATATSITTETKPISIGRPIANNRVYLLDHHQQLQSVGLPGELWIGGDSLARGYLHRAELTAKRFMDWNGERLYRTGDLARWLPDGRLEFLGRVDDQIQLRGYRIELGEIEGQLYQHPLVTQAIVLVHGKRTSQQRLIAYVVLKQPQVIQADQLHAFLKKQLPSYMLPAQIVELDQLPITANGKVDRQKLLSFAISKETALYEAPRNRTEDRLVDLWEEVLEVPRVGIHDHFYALGGHSLKAILLRARIQKEFGVHISIREIFDRPTVAALATYIDEAEKEGAVSFEQLPEQAYYPVSSAQKRMYILQKFENVGVGYNIPLVFSLDGQLNLARLKAGIQQLIQRHEVLRTSFQMIDDEVLQKVHADATLEIKQVKANTEEEARKYVEQWIQPFDLYQVPQIRAGLVELATNRSILLIDVPHIIADGVSINCLIQELIICYQDGDLKPLPYQYKEFAYWQQQWLKTKQAKQQQAYWLDQLSGELPKLELPTDYPRPTEQQFTGDIYQWSLPDELTKKLNQLAQDEKSSLYMVLMAAYSVWLMKMSGQQDVLIGTPFAGRTHADITQMLGMFVNTLPIRLKPDPTFTFRQLIHQVKEQLFAAYEAGDYPLEEVIAQLPLQRDPSRNPLFDTMFILQNHQQTQLTLPDVDIAPFPMQATTAKFDLTWTVIERDQLEMTIEYATHLFHSRSISSMADSFTHLLEQLMVHDTRLIKEISLLTKDQKAMQLAQAGQLVPYPAEKTLHQLFEEQAQRTPDAIAVIVEDQQLSYQELDQRSTQLGCLLRDQGVSRDSIVALQMQKSIEMIVGILAILKAGGAYLPIEPTYPKERVEYLLEDSEAALLLTTSSVEQSVAYTGKILCIDDPKLYTGNHVELPLINQSSDLAYLLYTSGSTGKPKGVMVEHRHVTRLWLYEGNQWQIQQTDRWAMFHSFCFDVSVGEIFGALLHGAALVLVTSEVARHPQQLRDLLAQEQVTILCQTPSAFIPLQAIEEDQTKHDLSLRRIIFAGEALAPAQLKAWRKWYPNTELLNMYGPTEAAIYATVKQIDDQLITSNRSNIGKPLPTMRAYVLDEHQQFVPTGVIGELYLSGAGVTRGYWKQPQLTADRFLPDPFLPDTQMYRTGDRVRWLNSGELEYMGRIDDQVKIRGHRIELGEITTHLLTHPSVKDAAVIVHQGELCAYLVGGYVAEIRAYLAKRLPEYMLPSYYISLEQLPLNTNGKLDRHALPEPTQNFSRDAAYIAPRTDLEKKLVSIWEEVLQITNIGIDDNFFSLGGHSLKGIALLARIEKQYHVSLSLRDLFAHPTVQSLGEVIQSTEASIAHSIVPVEERDFYPATSAQQRIYLLQGFEQVGTSYHIPMIMQIEGELDHQRLENALDQLVRRHETLRTTFHLDGDQLVQRVHQQIESKLLVATASSESSARGILEEWIQPFSLDQPPLFRAGLIKLPHHRSLFLLDLHHIIADGASLSIFWSELIDIYQEKELAPLSIQYKDFAVWQQEQLDKGKLKKDQSFWLKQLEQEWPVLQLPTDDPRPPIQQFDGASYFVTFSKELSEAINRLSVELHVTPYMLLLAAYSLLLMKYTEQTDLVIGSPQAGRQQAEVEPLVGMFVNTLPLRLQLNPANSFADWVQQVKEQMIATNEHGDYPIEHLIDQQTVRRDLSRNPLFDTVFSLQNLAFEQKNIPGLHYQPYERAGVTAKFDLSFIMVEEDYFHLSIEYASHLFKEETIARMAAHYQQLLTQIIAAPGRSLHEYSCLTVDEEKQLLAYADGGQQIGSSHQTLVERWERQVEQTPQSIALVDQGRSMTYEELNQRANQLAHRLRREGLQREQLVAIWTQRSLEWVVGILGALKAGGAYLPIDPHYPPERIMYMLKQSQASYLLVSANQSVPESFSGLTLHVDDPTLQQEEQGNPSLINQPHDLAYVIYTSGSTGRPKGVMVEHRAVLNLVQWHQEAYQVTEKDQATQFASVSFDAAVWELFPYLLQGATVHLIPEELRLDLEALHHYYEQTGITISFLPTPLAQRFMERDNRSLRALLVGGDQLRHVKPQSYQIYNNYGPTENTVVSTYCCIDPTQHRLPIGRPIANQQAYVLDEQQRLQPIGVPGELYLGGASLARGYLHDPEQTSAHFIPHPFQPGERLYRTGDRVRWLANGELEYLGRIDDQVSIRGYRVEVAEIEQTLLRHPAVQDGVVIARTEGEQTALAAYLVWANLDEAITLQELRADLLEQLPDYMIPVDWMVLDELPLTPNGKVDRRALPMPTRSDRMGQKYVAPRSDQEKLLVEVWQGILPGEQFGIYDHFFEQGGDSIQAMHVVAKLREKYYHISMKDIFQAPTVEQLALRMQQIDKNHLKKEKMVTGEVMLTPIQQWAFELSANIHHWNMGHMLYRAEGWNEQIVEQVWTKIVQHHDGLRMIYQWTDTGVLQRNRAMDEGIYFTLEVIDLRQVREPRERVLAEANRLQQSIRLDQGPLIRLAIFRTNHGDHLLWVIHHLVVDAVSLRILVEDFYTAYGQLLNQQVITLPPVSDSFQTWSRQLAQYANSQELIREIPYWQQLEQLNVLPLPTDFPTTETYAIGEGKIVLMELTSKETNALQSIGYEVQTVLLAALVSVVSEWGVGDRVAILMEGHGRQDILSEIDVTRTVGWFTTLYPMIFQRNASSTQHLLKSINEQLRSVPHQGIGYGLLKYLTKPSLRSALSFQLQPEISFNYLGKMDSYRLDAMPVGYAVDPQTQIKEKIEVNSAITGEGKLVLSFRYSPKAYRQETMERLMQQYREQLLKIIRYANHVTHS
ncbi:fengycin family lipopeptide synthetase D/tyrocidine synthetase-2 [Seinonella peptonophila]|uniref:Fengycin family lipopeptide synthetase D/tyrocidine synthetase-2 n=1 Tax=Seinonella peptonophila TaxID=112248 RepID=A0A1M4VIE8_9BACL|nr:non-ribosomal peptide synthetase [Seinonella peptonophila]SHE68680.1 fengycin family lipopeptide synthetase D/tyrocidine synthetase-2 [Seinonella peptonophila]